MSLFLGEKATRIWEFWKSIVVRDDQFPAFSVALRLIVLIQVSSCAVERVFSQLAEMCSGGATHEDVHWRLECLLCVMET